MAVENKLNSRRNFIITSCKACVAVGFIGNGISSCQPTRYATALKNKEGLVVQLSEFVTIKNKQSVLLPFIIVRDDSLLYPIYVYRKSAEEFGAVWMKCSHQGTELKADGVKLYCPAHGSEFNNVGKVLNGPAAENLRSFPVIKNEKELFIDLRKS